MRRYYHVVVSAKGSSSPKSYAGGAGLIYRTFPDGSKTLLDVVKMPLGRTPQTAAEYISLIRALRNLLRRFSAENSQPKRATVRIFCDGELLIKQMSGASKVKSRNLRVLHAIACGLTAPFAEVRYEPMKGSQNEDVMSASRSAVGPMGIADAPIIEWCPNLALISDVWVDGVRIPASNDMHGPYDEEHHVIDAQFLISLPSYGLEALRLSLRDSTPLEVLRGNNFEANVLGVISMNFSFDFLRSRRDKNAPNRGRSFDVIVVDNLPVPMHISTGNEQVFEEDMPEAIEYPHRIKMDAFNFAEEYQTHPYWQYFDPKTSGFDPTPEEED